MITAMQFTRKRKQETNYRSRLKLLMSGKDRLVVRKTSGQIIVQLTKYDEKGDLVKISANSAQLKKYGWNLSLKNLPAAYLTGLLAGRLAVQKGIKEAVLDAGANKPAKYGRIYAALKGTADAGLKVPCSQEIFPSEERIGGQHIAKYMQSAQHPQFSTYKNADVSKIFSSAKAKILDKK